MEDVKKRLRLNNLRIARFKKILNQGELFLVTEYFRNKKNFKRIAYHNEYFSLSFLYHFFIICFEMSEVIKLFIVQLDSLFLSLSLSLFLSFSYHHHALYLHETQKFIRRRE